MVILGGARHPDRPGHRRGDLSGAGERAVRPDRALAGDPRPHLVAVVLLARPRPAARPAGAAAGACLTRCWKPATCASASAACSATDSRLASRSTRRDARDHRPQRRRQDDAWSPSSPASCAPDHGTVRLRRRRHHALEPPTARRARALRARFRSPACSATSPRSTTSRWRCRRAPARLPLLAPGAPRRRAARSRPRRARRMRPRRPCRYAGRRAVARRTRARSNSRWRSPTRPRLLLLDEPLAGMGPEESARMVAPARHA